MPSATAPLYPTSQAPTFDMSAAGALLSGSFGTSQSTSDFYAQNFKGITVVLDVSNFNGATLTVVIEGKDSASGQYFPLLTSGSLTSTRTTSHTIYPGLTPGSTANQSSTANNILPAVFRIRVTVATATATFTVGAVLTT